MEGQDGLDGVVDGVRAVRFQLEEAAGIVVAIDEVMAVVSQDDGQQGEKLVVDIAYNQLVGFAALLQNIQVLRSKQGKWNTLKSRERSASMMFRSYAEEIKESPPTTHMFLGIIEVRKNHLNAPRIFIHTSGSLSVALAMIFFIRFDFVIISKFCLYSLLISSEKFMSD